MTYHPEKYQLGIVTEFLEDRGYNCCDEVMVDFFPVDIIAHKDGTVMAVELKTRNHSKGVLQAMRNTSYVDRSYLAVWSHEISSSLLTEVEEKPIGLLSVDVAVEVLSTAEQLSPYPELKHDALMKIQEVDNGV